MGTNINNSLLCLIRAFSYLEANFEFFQVVKVMLPYHPPGAQPSFFKPMPATPPIPAPGAPPSVDKPQRQAGWLVKLNHSSEGNKIGEAELDDEQKEVFKGLAQQLNTRSTSRYTF